MVEHSILVQLHFKCQSCKRYWVAVVSFLSILGITPVLIDGQSFSVVLPCLRRYAESAVVSSAEDEDRCTFAIIGRFFKEVDPCVVTESSL